MSFVASVHAALELAHRRDSASAVHEVVANALHRLDARSEIKLTGYFAHSFVPDIVVRWGDDEQRHERHVHLRHSVLGPSFRDDLEMLSSDAPLFLGMTDTTTLSEAAWQRGASQDLAGSLVTQAPAVDELEEGAKSEGRSQPATRALVREGHGVLDAAKAENITDTYARALGAIADGGNDGSPRSEVSDALRRWSEMLPEGGQLEVERALQSEWIRHGRDPHDFPGTTPWNPEMLDTASLRDVLLSLLKSTGPVAPETWQRNAGFIRAEDIGRILGRSLRGGKFNEMAHALLPNWTAKWVWTECAESPPLFENYDWIVDNGLLGIDASDIQTFFADDGRHFKDKAGGAMLPLLSEAQQMLSQSGLMQVGLKGTMEGIRYEPLSRTGSGVFHRLQALLSAPEAPSYRVQSVRTVVPGTDAVADVDLDRRIIDLQGQSTPVASLARLAARFFSRADVDGLDHFLATGQPPPAVAAEAS